MSKQLYQLTETTALGPDDILHVQIEVAGVMRDRKIKRSRLTLAQNAVQSFPSITGLTGGGANNLDGIVTLNSIAANVIITPNLADGKIWQLVSGVAANAAGIQRPADYDATTNAVTWQSIL